MEPAEPIDEELSKRLEWFILNQNKIVEDSGIQDIVIAPEDTFSDIKMPDADFGYAFRANNEWSIVKTPGDLFRIGAFVSGKQLVSTSKAFRPNDKCNKCGKKYKKCRCNLPKL